MLEPFAGGPPAPWGRASRRLAAASTVVGRRRQCLGLWQHFRLANSHKDPCTHRWRAPRDGANRSSGDLPGHCGGGGLTQGIDDDRSARR